MAPPESKNRLDSAALESWLHEEATIERSLLMNCAPRWPPSMREQRPQKPTVSRNS